MEENESGFFDLPEWLSHCRSPEHEPPTGICIPSGQGYRHVCPQCGVVRILMGDRLSL